jgi:uncharacterized protein YjbJ (UPF0337 family)
VKKAVGKAVGNRALEKKGRRQNAHGKAQANFGDQREDFKESDLDGSVVDEKTAQ